MTNSFPRRPWIRRRTFISFMTQSLRLSTWTKRFRREKTKNLTIQWMSTNKTRCSLVSSLSRFNPMVPSTRKWRLSSMTEMNSTVWASKRFLPLSSRLICTRKCGTPWRKTHSNISLAPTRTLCSTGPSQWASSRSSTSSCRHSQTTTLRRVLTPSMRLTSTNTFSRKLNFLRVLRSPAAGQSDAAWSILLSLPHLPVLLAPLSSTLNTRLCHPIKTSLTALVSSKATSEHY